MAANPHAEHLQELLEGLNEPQREAVTHGEGPLLILAGAGSGKTRVLTHRIAFLIYTDQAQAGEILAITFTNKAANEMRERVERLLGHSTRGMWVMTFHSACARILRAEAERLGYTRQFTIYDQADARRLTKRSADAVGVDPKRYTPAAIHNQISAAKNRLIDAESYRQQVGSPFEEMIADVYDIYERDLHRMNAMDFDDLLFRVVNLLELFEDVRERYRNTFRHVLVDEYQDTNHAQYRLLQLLVGGGRPPQRGEAQPGDRPTYSGPVGHRNLAVVGDDAQCLVTGTLVTMADGTRRPIEKIRAGDRVLSCFGSGNFRPAAVTNVFRSCRTDGIRIRTAAGREIVSTPEHTHFAGYRNGLTPSFHATYLMRKRGVGWRVGTTRTAINQRGQATPGVQLRAMTERADDAWVVSTHETAEDARVAEAILAARYGLPMVPFRARAARGVLSDQALIDKVFAEVDTRTGGERLLCEEGLTCEEPHHVWQGFDGKRRIVTVTLAADRSGADRNGAPLHTVSMGGRDTDVRGRLERMGLKVSQVGGRAVGWRSETYFKSFEDATRAADSIGASLDVTLRYVARLGKPRAGQTNALPFTRASSIRPGMVMFDEHAGYDSVVSVERVALDDAVYDLNVADTHNFIAAGLITHNSIYSFRGADVENILGFQNDFPDARVVKLEQNYRSTETILRAANAVITNNRGGIAKRLWSELGRGEQIKLRVLEDEYAEARYVVGEIQRLIDEGGARSEIAVLYRTNALSRALEETLTREDIAYQVIGGTKFFERAEIKDAIAYLSLLANPADLVSFMRVVNSPRRGIGKTSLAHVLTHAAALGISVWEAAAQPDQVPGLGTAAVKALGRFMDTMNELRAKVGGPIVELLEAMLSQTGYIQALEADGTIEAQGRIENLQQLVEGGRKFDENADGDEDLLGAYLQEIALVADADSRSDEGVVTLMTLHNAKGLEYPIVFIAGCEDGVFPHSRAIEEGALEEERRLFYVGITRAMRQLYLTHTRKRAVFGAPTPGRPSRFLAEIPGDLLEETLQATLRPGSWLPGSSPGRRVSMSGRQGTGQITWAQAASTPDPIVVRRVLESKSPVSQFQLGDDVVDPKFGDGVVIGVKSDGIVVRFARDGSERTLLTEFLRVTRR